MGRQKIFQLILKNYNVYLNELHSEQNLLKRLQAFTACQEEGIWSERPAEDPKPILPSLTVYSKPTVHCPLDAIISSCPVFLKFLHHHPPMETSCHHLRLPYEAFPV